MRYLFFSVIFVCYVGGIANKSVGLILFALFLLAGYFTWALIDYLFLKPNRKRKEKLREQKSTEKITKEFEKLEKGISDKVKNICQQTIYKHRFALQAERKKFLTKDSYGKEIDIGWVTSENLKGDKSPAIFYFIKNVLDEELESEFKNINYPEIIFNSDGEEEEFYDSLDWVKYCFAKRKLPKDIDDINYWIVEEIEKVSNEWVKRVVSIEAKVGKKHVRT